MSGKIRVSSGLHRMHQVTITHASLSDASPSCWTSRNHYGWHISLKRKFTQISRHLFETHKIRLVTVKVVVAVRQHAKQTNKKLAHTAYVPEPRIGARRHARATGVSNEVGMHIHTDAHTHRCTYTQHVCPQTTYIL